MDSCLFVITNTYLEQGRYGKSGCLLLPFRGSLGRAIIDWDSKS